MVLAFEKSPSTLIGAGAFFYNISFASVSLATHAPIIKLHMFRVPPPAEERLLLGRAFAVVLIQRTPSLFLVSEETVVY